RRARDALRSRARLLPGPHLRRARERAARGPHDPRGDEHRARGAAGGVSGALEFRARTRIVAGWGCARRCLPDELAALGVRTIGVIADRGFAEAGLLDPLLSEARGVHVPLCALIGIDPDVDEAEAAALAAIARGAEAILAV